MYLEFLYLQSLGISTGTSIFLCVFFLAVMWMIAQIIAGGEKDKWQNELRKILFKFEPDLAYRWHPWEGPPRFTPPHLAESEEYDRDKKKFRCTYHLSADEARALDAYLWIKRNDLYERS